jgi:hypothetical protein
MNRIEKGFADDPGPILLKITLSSIRRYLVQTTEAETLSTLKKIHIAPALVIQAFLRAA